MSPMNFYSHCLFTLVMVCFITNAWADSSPSPAELYPNRLITPGFGIVGADDLAYDATNRKATPYDSSKDLFGRYWQCIPIKDVTPNYDTWRGQDGMGPEGVITKMCTLGVFVHGVSGLQIYGDRRAHPNSFCREFDRNWRRLTKHQDVVCLNGDDPSNENDEINQKYRSWTWNKFKTRTGCYSYFGDCDVKGCAQGKCPK